MSENEAVGASCGLVPVIDGEWAGWSTWQSDAFEQRAGPFYERREEDGSMVAAFYLRVTHRRRNTFSSSRVSGLATRLVATSYFKVTHRQRNTLSDNKV